MAKKSFQSGLEDLFMDALESPPIAKEKTVTSAKSEKKKKSTKSFSADLDSLFQETIEESVKEQAAQLKQGKKPRKPKPKPKAKRSKPSFGLDALIRQTVQTSKVTVPKDKKRVTFVFDKEKIEKLKSIARLEKAYLKDIVDSLVSEYISKHEN